MEMRGRGGMRPGTMQFVKSEEPARPHPSGMLFALVAAGFAAFAAWPALGVRSCPASGQCEWSPWLGVPAALIGVLALVAAARFVRWSVRGTDGSEAAVLLGVAVVLGVLWFVAFLVVLGATAR